MVSIYHISNVMFDYSRIRNIEDIDLSMYGKQFEP